MGSLVSLMCQCFGVDDGLFSAGWVMRLSVHILEGVGWLVERFVLDFCGLGWIDVDGKVKVVY